MEVSDQLELRAALLARIDAPIRTKDCRNKGRLEALYMENVICFC